MDRRTVLGTPPHCVYDRHKAGIEFSSGYVDGADRINDTRWGVYLRLCGQDEAESKLSSNSRGRSQRRHLRSSYRPLG